MKYNSLRQWFYKLRGHETLKIFGRIWWSHEDNEEFDCPTTARPRLIETWLALAQQSTDPERQLRYYEGVLKLEPEHAEARQHVQELRAHLQPQTQLESHNATSCATS